MRGTLARWTLGALAPLALAAAAAAAGGFSVTTTTEGGTDPQDCGRIQVRFGDRGDGTATVHGERRLAIGRAEAPSLRIGLDGPSGVWVQGWDRDEWAITACAWAGARRAEAAEALLEDVAVRHAGGRLEVTGPPGEVWMVHLLVRAPARAEVDVRTENGGISLREIAGRARARSTNGPIDLHGVSGEVDVETENGPIGAQGGSGRLSLRTENGPISVALDAGRWRGDGLAAKTENGPLSLELPAVDVPSLSVEMSGHAPVTCKAPQCDRARRTWTDDARRIEMGEGPAAVRLSTRNGPVSIGTRRGLHEI